MCGVTLGLGSTVFSVLLRLILFLHNLGLCSFSAITGLGSRCNGLLLHLLLDWFRLLDLILLGQ